MGGEVFFFAAIGKVVEPFFDDEVEAFAFTHAFYLHHAVEGGEVGGFKIGLYAAVAEFDNQGHNYCFRLNKK